MNLLAPLQGTKFTAAGVAWLTSFGIVNITTGQAVVAAFFACISAGLAAWLASRPALINARTAADQQHTTEQAQADARLERLHASEVAWLQSRITYNGRVIVLIRKSKHNLVNYIDSVHKHIYALNAELKLRGVEAPAFQFKYYDDLCGDEDRAMAQLTLPADFQPGEIQKTEA